MAAYYTVFKIFFFCSSDSGKSIIFTEALVATTPQKKRRCRFLLFVEKNSGASATAAEKTAALHNSAAVPWPPRRSGHGCAHLWVYLTLHDISGKTNVSCVGQDNLRKYWIKNLHPNKNFSVNFRCHNSQIGLKLFSMITADTHTRGTPVRSAAEESTSLSDSHHTHAYAQYVTTFAASPAIFSLQ